MDKLFFKDAGALVAAVKNHPEIFPIHVDREKVQAELEAYYEKELANRKFKGRMRLAKCIGAKLPVVRKKAARRFASGLMSGLMEIYSQSRCDTYIRDAIADLSANGDKYMEVYDLLDEDSKRIYVDLLLLRLTGDLSYALEHFNSSRQYFSEKVKWKKHPNVIDCGAFTGDTFLSFYDMGIIPDHYFLYELEDENYKKLLDSLNGKNCKAHPRKKGVYSENSTFYYESIRDSSRLVPYETKWKVDVVALDNDVNIAPDFIKMDIEGGELSALMGAANLIKKYRPTLAICIYHLKDDFWKIPLYIHEICPQYRRYWLEHYSPAYNETVLFVAV